MIAVDAETLVTWVAFLAAVAAILTAVLSSSRRLERRISGVDERLGGAEQRLDAKIDGVGERLDAKIDGVEQRLDAKIDRLGERLDAKIDGVEQRLDAKIDRLGERLDAKIDGVDTKLSDRLDGLQRELTEFRLETREEFGRVHAQLGRHEEKLALWERFIWARTAPELLGGETLTAGAREPNPGPAA